MFKNASLFIAGAMVIMCFVMAYFVLFTDILMDKGLTGSKRQLFVVLMLAYGIFRGYRIYATIKNNRKES